MRNGVFPAISVNKDVTIISDCCHPHELVSPEGTQEGKNTCHLAAIRLQPLPTANPEETHAVKTRILAPDSWGAYQKNCFSEPRLLHLPIHEKMLNSLTWDIWFSLIYNNFLTSRLPAFCCKICITWFFPSPPQSSSLRIT